MRVRFLGKESQPNQSPSLYATDRESYIVQGWIVTDPALLALIDLDDEETVVEVPAKLMALLAKDGLTGEVNHRLPPIVLLTDSGNYIVKGARVTDAEALGRMDIPDHETCVEVTKPAMLALLTGG